MLVNKKIILLSLLTLVVILCIVLFYPHNCLFFNGVQICETNWISFSNYLYFVDNLTWPATSLFPHERCLGDADIAKSNFLNGNLDTGDDPWPCYSSARIFSLNNTSDIQTMLDCIGLYEMREKELQRNNDYICERLEIPECNAVQIVSFPEFQKKYCDFW